MIEIGPQLYVGRIGHIYTLTVYRKVPDIGAVEVRGRGRCWDIVIHGTGPFEFVRRVSFFSVLTVNCVLLKLWGIKY